MNSEISNLQSPSPLPAGIIVISFYIGSYFMLALMVANFLNLEFLGVPLLDTGYALVASIVINSLTFLGLRMYFDRKGDF